MATRLSRLPFVLLALICLAHGMARAEPNLPDLGDESAALISPIEERRMGEDFMRQARAQLNLLADPQINEYLQTVGHRVSRDAVPAPGIQFFVVNNPVINAFAIPGGYIGVHTGLLLATRSEAELAAVLAHETAHLAQRHIPRMIADSQRASIPTMAAILAGILLAASTKGAGGEATVAMATAGMAQHQINFTRAFEEEADRIGMKFLNSAGYDARAMPAFFERMDSLTRLDESDLPEFLRDHPVTSRRIAESRDHATEFPKRTEGDSTDFLTMQARLRVLVGNADEAVRYFRSNLDQGSRALSSDRYGLALALLNSNQPEAARQENEILLRQNPGFLAYQLLRADIEVATGNTGNALNDYAATVRQFPQSRAAVQKYADALIKNRRYADAARLLDQAVRNTPDEPELYRLLATAAGESGHPMEAHRAFGEYYYRIGQPRAAIDQLEIAIRHANNSFYYVSSLEARIREIREQAGIPGKDSQKSRPAKSGNLRIF